jgi:hypothetical protein
MNNRKFKSVFLSGCGGGYDIFGGLSHYFKMKSSGNHDVTLINYSFTKRDLLSEYSQQLTTLLFRIDPTIDSSWLTDEIYFPEQRLANELQVVNCVIDIFAHDHDHGHEYHMVRDHAHELFFLLIITITITITKFYALQITITITITNFPVQIHDLHLKYNMIFSNMMKIFMVDRAIYPIYCIVHGQKE